MFRRLYVQTLYVRYFYTFRRYTFSIYTFRFIRSDVIRSDVIRSVFIRSDIIRSGVIRSVIIRSVGESKLDKAMKYREALNTIHIAPLLMALIPCLRRLANALHHFQHFSISFQHYQ